MANTTAIDPSLVIEELRAEIRALSERLERLEAQIPLAPIAAEAQAPLAAAPAEPVHEEISEEILMVISAAVAAFLGERAHVKQVRLIRSPAWAQQGRVTIQASHQLQH
jgi:methylmalonyl-CoA carboxyltransferase large subunit